MYRKDLDWTEDELEILEMLLDTPTMQEVADGMGRGLRQVVSKLTYMRKMQANKITKQIDTGSEPESAIKNRAMTVEESLKRVRMFENLRKGQAVMFRKKKKNKLTVPITGEIIANNGSYVICQLKNKNMINITKAEMVTREVLMAVLKEVV